MIERIEISGVHFDVDDRLRKYTLKKLGGLDRYLGRQSRGSAYLHVSFKESRPRGGSKLCHCDVTLRLPHDTIVIKEATINIYAAVDIAEAKLKLQLRKYKGTHEPGRLRLSRTKD